jgi:hypothetical protein
MFKPIRIILAGIAFLAIILIVAVVGIFWYVDVLAKRGVEAGGTYALGVNTTVRSVDVGLFRGTVALDGLNIANPQGFTAPTFLTMDDGRTEVEIRSLFGGDIIRIPQLHLNSLDINLQRLTDGRTNYRAILDSIERLSSPETPDRAPAEPERRLIISELVIRNITIHADLGAPAALGEITGRSGIITIPIPEIRLKDVGQTGEGVGGTGITIGQLAGLIVEAILAAAVEHGGDLLPADFLNDLRSRLAELGNIERLTGAVEGIARDLGRQLEGVRSPEEIGDVLRRGRDEIKDLIPRRDPR